ncbi:hypothetical protein FJ251_12870 [bacterium]|nr:hypothetical protein [bacterium]
MDYKEIQTATVSLYLQLELRRRALQEVSAVEAASWLERAGILTDSRHRPGLPLRNLLRSGLILGQRQESGRWWFIDRIELRSVDFRRAGG